MIYGGESQFSQRRFSSDNTPYEKIGENVHSLAEFAPFEIPLSWEWCRVGDLFTNTSGLAYKKESLNVKSERMVRVLRGGNIADGHYCLKSDDVFISSEFVKPELFLKKHYMITPAVSSLDHIGKIALIEENIPDTVVGGFVLMLIPLFEDEILSKYLLYAFSSKHHRDNCRSITHKSGQAFYNLSRELLMNLPVPVPPRHEMKRIVEKLENILPHVDEYAIFEQESNTLNKVFPDMLKKSILQMAVQGKLVPQDPDDEPASVLLERIRAEKQRLIAEGKIKRDKHESVIFRRDNSHYEKCGVEEICIDDVIPFDIPESWTWVRLITLIEEKPANGYSPKAVGYSTNVKNLTLTATTSGYFKFDAYKYVDIAIPSDSKYWLKHNDILVQRSNSRGLVGTACIYPGEDNAFIYPDLMMRIRIMNGIDIRYIDYVLKSPFIRQYYTRSASGTSESMPKINQAIVSNTLIPLPPIAEQRRITKCIDKLLSRLTF